VDRIATFLKFIERSPKDPFPVYGLAMEYKSQQRWSEADETFARLVESFPDYVAAYLQAGEVKKQLGLPDDAKEILRRGIAAASAKGDGHAKKELEAALAELG
jgi:tetratricopeptide (TPR) repeat protein